MPHYKVVRAGDPPDLGWFLGGTLFGLLLGAIVFTQVGRSLAVAAIKKGAAVTEEKVKEWLAKGEE
jgi:hypothetical protein